MLTNDVARAREDVLRIAHQHVLTAGTQRRVSSADLVWALTEAEYKALLAKLQMAGYQLEPEAVAGDDEGGTDAEREAVQEVVDRAKDRVVVTIRFRPIAADAN